MDQISDLVREAPFNNWLKHLTKRGATSCRAEATELVDDLIFCHVERSLFELCESGHDSCPISEANCLGYGAVAVVHGGLVFTKVKKLVLGPVIRDLEFFHPKPLT